VTSPTVAVLVPWRPIGCPHRDAAWAAVQHHWTEAGFVVIVGDDGGDPFSRAASLNRAAAEVDVDVYVVADADTLVDVEQVAAAITLANSSLGMVLAYTEFCYLNDRGTALALRSTPAERRRLFGAPDRDRYLSWCLSTSVSSCVVVSAATWHIVGGFDPRFRGWGMEDVAFFTACETLTRVATRRIPGPVLHLSHPSEPIRPAANVALLDRYNAARANPAAMRHLVVEHLALA